MGPTTQAPGTAPLSPAATLSQMLARYPTIDPRAALAVAGQEGLSGGIGDGGHAFGPFQLNDAGGVLTGMFPGRTPEQLNQWAWSPAGLNYALQRVNQVASGLHGRDAVANIVSRFERPANIPGEISRAEAGLGGVTPQQYPAAFAPGAGIAASSPIAAQFASRAAAPPAAPRVKPISPVLRLALQILNS